MMSAKYFEYYTIILRGAFFVDSLRANAHLRAIFSLPDCGAVLMMSCCSPFKARYTLPVLTARKHG